MKLEEWVKDNTQSNIQITATEIELQAKRELKSDLFLELESFNQKERIC